VTDATPAPAAEKQPVTGFVINVGLFAQDDNARRVQARLNEAGLPVFTQELQRASGSLTRVRVGPYTGRAEADDAAQKIRALQLDAVATRQ
jgi:DedD protein